MVKYKKHVNKNLMNQLVSEVVDFSVDGIKQQRSVISRGTNATWVYRPLLGFPDFGRVMGRDDIGNPAIVAECDWRDAQFIANAKQMWPKALDEIELLQIGIEAAKEENRQLRVDLVNFGGF